MSLKTVPTRERPSFCIFSNPKSLIPNSSSEEGEEVAGGFIVACGDAAALFEPRESTLDVVALAVQWPVVGALDVEVPLGRNDRLNSVRVDRLKHLITVVAFVGDDVFRRESCQQGRGLSDVGRLTGREQKLHGIAQSIADRVNLRSESATRSAEFMNATFFRAPTA